MHRPYFLFARGLTPPLFRIECQLEDLTRYTMWFVLWKEKKNNKRISSIEQMSRECWHAFFVITIATIDKENLLRISSISEKSEPDRNLRFDSKFILKLFLWNDLHSLFRFCYLSKWNLRFLKCFFLIWPWLQFLFESIREYYIKRELSIAKTTRDCFKIYSESFLHISSNRTCLITAYKTCYVFTVEER